MHPKNDFLTLANQLRGARDAEGALRTVAEAAIDMTGSAQATVRLLDKASGLLLVTARSGDAMHRGGAGRFQASSKKSAIGWCVEHGKPLRIDDPATDERFVKRAGQTWMPSGILAVPLLERDRAVGVLSVARREGWFPYTDHDLDTLQLIAELAAPFLQIERLVGLAETDALTLLHNRHHLEWRLPAELATAQRRGEPMGAVLLDMDHFGAINKEHGFPVGDVAIRSVADNLRDTSRGSDILCRVGGEEFLMLLPGSTAESASRFAERLRAHIEATPVEAPDVTLKLTASLGAAAVHPHDDLPAVLERLDRPLRRAKQEGRNCVRVESAPPCDWRDFFDHTRAVWQRVPAAPDRGADFESKTGSRYWNTGDGVYRASDHWNEDIHGCTWLLDGAVCQEPAVGYSAYTDMVRQRASA